MSTLAELDAACEAAWKRYDTAQRALPAGGQAAATEARREHLAALRERDWAVLAAELAAVAPEQPPAAVPVLLWQPSLFEDEEAA